MVDQPAIVEAEEAAGQPYDTSDPETVNKARKKAARHHRGHLDVVASLMGLKEGRAWMWGLLEAAHMFQPSFVQGDPYLSAFREGERNFGLRLLSDVMDVAPDDYVTMSKEAKNRV